MQYVYAVRHIKKGEQLCVHYTNLHEPRRVRQQQLLQARFFQCACERCSVPIEKSIDRFMEVTHTSGPALPRPMATVGTRLLCVLLSDFADALVAC